MPCKLQPITPTGCPEPQQINVLWKGFPTLTRDINGQVIKLGDIVGYDFKGDKSTFEVVFEDNAFRKRYKDWDETLQKPMLEYGDQALKMRLKIIG